MLTLRPLRSRFVRAGLLSIVAASAAHAQRARPASRAALTRTLDSIVTAEMAARHWPSVAVMMVRGRDTILAKGYGKADLEMNVPASVNGVYWIGSVTKQFVTAALLKLAERGVLSVNDTVGKWVPNLPTTWRSLTMRDLAWHTSGIASYTGQPRSGLALVKPFTTSDTALALVRDVAPDFPRGTQMLYNNTGYLLLGQVIERATGKALGVAIRDELFTPLGLTHMSYCDLRTVVPNRVSGYSRIGSGASAKVERAVLWWPEMAHGAGALCGTVGDLVAWSRLLHGGKVLSPESYRTMTTVGQLNDGTPLRYAMGLVRGEVAGRPALYHTGGIAGFTTWLAYLPDDSVHIAMTVSMIAGSERPSLAGIKIVERVLGARPVTAAPMSEALPGMIVGSYGSMPRAATVAESNGALTLTMTGGTPLALTYRGAIDGAEQFLAADGAIVRFERSTNTGTITRVHVDGGTSHLVLDRR